MIDTTKGTIRRILMAGCAAGAVATAAMMGATPVAAQSAQHQYAIGGQDLGAALRAFALASGRDVVFDPGLVRGKRTNGVNGALDDDDALRQLLAGSGLSFDQTASGGFVVRVERADDASEATKVQEVVVTGTHIHGNYTTGSPLIQIDRKQIELSGFSDTDQVVSSLTQDFSGGQNRVTSITTYTGANSSNDGGSGVNLRGLGAEGSLVLLDGQRLAPSGLAGNYVDVTMIPLAAIDRVDVLADGASAIYGSDAIGGVVNFITRKDYDGAETRVRYGGATDGGGDQLQIGQLFGRTWEGGSALLNYEYESDDPITAGQRGITSNLPSVDDIYPEVRKNSGIIAIDQTVASNTSIFLDALYTARSLHSNVNVDFGGGLLVPDTYTVSSDSYSAIFGAKTRLSSNWNLTVLGNVARESTNTTSFYGPPFSFGSATDWRSSVYELDANADGPIAQLPGGAANLALGGSLRRESFLSTATPSTPQSSRTVYAGYAELILPFVGPGNAVPGVERLSVDAAARYEHYSDFGSTTNPKVGVVWSPVSGVDIRGTYGTSFRAPLLSQLHGSTFNLFAIPWPLPNGSTEDSIYLQGGNPSLRPETATTWSGGVDIGPAALPGVKASLNYFKVSFANKIEFPFDSVTSNDSDYLVDPSLSQYVIQNPSASLVDQLFSNPKFANYCTPACSPSDIKSIIDDNYTNAASVREDGVDVALSYVRETSIGMVGLSANATYILHLTQKLTANAPTISTLNSVFQPVGFRMRDGVTWKRDEFTGAIFVNYTNSYKDNSVTPIVPVSSWTTVDMTFVYNVGTEHAENQILRNLAIAFNVQNLFDAPPPYINTSYGGLNEVHFDGANANPLGRLVSLELRKWW